MFRTILRILVTCVAVLHLSGADVCNPNPCKNGGTCQPIDYGYNWGYHCNCLPGFFAAQCQWDSVDCSQGTSTPCVNGGVCSTMQDGRFCLCPGTTDRTVAYGGHYCEIVNPCSTCPQETDHCQPGTYATQGRLCLDQGSKVIA